MNSGAPDPSGRLPGCEVCELLRTSGPENLVLDGDHFRVLHTSAYPWGLVVCSAQHNEGLWTLSDEEASEFGRLVVRVAAAMRQTWTDKVYAVTFGEDEEALSQGLAEREPHFLMMLLARCPPISDAVHEAMDANRDQLRSQEVEASCAVAAVRQHLRAAGQ